MPEGLKITLLTLLGAGALLFGYLTMTVPMLVMTGPALVTIALGVGFVLVWRVTPKETAATREP